MKTLTDAHIKKMEQDRKYLLAEAESYVMKKNSDTNQMVKKMDFIKDMMDMYYKHNDGRLTSEDFSKVMSHLISQIPNL